MLDWPSVVIGSAATVLVLCIAAFLLYHFWPMDDMRDAKKRAARALEQKAASQERYERQSWRNWMVW